MTRVVLPNRRSSITEPMIFHGDAGHQVKVLITIGFNAKDDPIEVFCADFKAGTALHAIVMDACILFSRLLQHGDLPDDLEQSMCQPHSLLGSIAAAVARYQRPAPHRDASPPNPIPASPSPRPVTPSTMEEVPNGID